MTDFPLVTIEQTVTESSRRGRGKAAGPVKTRRFSVTLLGWTAADSMWFTTGQQNVTQPVWMAYAGSESAVRAFTANLRCGHKAAMSLGPGHGEYRGDIFQIPKRSGHRWVQQRLGDSALGMVYLPEPFHLEPNRLGEQGRIDFLFMPPLWWLDAQTERLRPELGHDAREAAHAALFVAFLDRRTPRPLVNDLRFHLQLYRAALEQPWVMPAKPPGERWARRAGHVYAFNTRACGLAEPLRVGVAADAFEQFLTAQTTTYFEQEIQHGTSRIPSTGRFLPYPELSGHQLRLDFAAAGG